MLHRSLCALGLVVLGGCTSMASTRSPPAPGPSAAESVQATQLASYFSALQTVVQGSPAEQAEVMAAARNGYEQAHQGPAALRYGLLLAAPSHPARDPAQAQRLLREALARPELLSSVERALAIVEQAQVEHELGMSIENQRLVAEAQQERERQRNAPPSATLARRLQQEIEESARLKRELDAARAKLEAIANIERSLPDRPASPEPRRP
jgi:hypothetical protein